MNQPSACEMRAYLNDHYYTLEELAKAAKTDEEMILKLIHAQCIPPHSYTEQTTSTFTNSLIQYAANPSCINYYHPSLVKWIEKALIYLQHMGFSETAQQVREDFSRDFIARLGHTETPGCKDTNDAWSALMDGTWGICLKDLTIECLAKKQLARLEIATIVKSKTDYSLTPTEKSSLISAINAYNDAVMDFDPYYAPNSSRYREVVSVKLKYKL